MLPLNQRFRDSQIVIVTNFALVSSVGKKRGVCINRKDRQAGLWAQSPVVKGNRYTVKPQWLEPLWDHGNLFEIWVLRATEGQS